jgi:hypothetical protein
LSPSAPPSPETAQNRGQQRAVCRTWRPPQAFSAAQAHHSVPYGRARHSEAHRSLTYSPHRRSRPPQEPAGPHREAKPRPRANEGSMTTPGAALTFLRHADCPMPLLGAATLGNCRIQTETPLRRGGGRQRGRALCEREWGSLSPVAGVRPTRGPGEPP